MDDLVECYSGSEYAERPVAFKWEGERLEVHQVLAHWRTPDGKHFRVLTPDERIFDLTYLEARQIWSVLPV